MDISTDKSSIPTTDDQGLADLLAGLNQEQKEASAATEEVTTTTSSDAVSSVTADDTSDTTAETPAESVESNSIPELDIESPPAETATPSPVNVIDELNARDTQPTIVGSTATMRSTPTVDELTTPVNKPLEPLELDAATIAAASDEAEQKAAVADSIADLTPSAAEEINSIRDKVLNYLSEMIRDINQPPQEKFETVISILRGTGDRSLLKDALETAIKIEDPSDKAKALVEFVGVLDEMSLKK